VQIRGEEGEGGEGVGGGERGGVREEEVGKGEVGGRRPSPSKLVGPGHLLLGAWAGPGERLASSAGLWWSLALLWAISWSRQAGLWGGGRAASRGGGA
jgi:hypothetical protein